MRIYFDVYSAVKYLLLVKGVAGPPRGSPSSLPLLSGRRHATTQQNRSASVKSQQ